MNFIGSGTLSILVIDPTVPTINMVITGPAIFRTSWIIHAVS